MSVTTIAQEQELYIPRIFCSNFVPLPSTSPHIYDSLVSRAVVSNAHDAINSATELSVLLMEPRTIEQMNVDPLVVDESFAWIWDHRSLKPANVRKMIQGNPQCLNKRRTFVPVYDTFKDPSSIQHGK
jgi:hypothetical protein